MAKRSAKVASRLRRRRRCPGGQGHQHPLTYSSGKRVSPGLAMHYLFSKRVFSTRSLLLEGFSDFNPFSQKADRRIIPFYYIQACCRRNGHNLGRQGLTSSFRGQNRIVLRSSPVFSKQYGRVHSF